MNILDKSGSTATDERFSAAHEDYVTRPRFKTSLEKQLEKLWGKASHQGWSFSDFTAQMLEVLLVLRQRDQLKSRLAPAKPHRRGPRFPEGALTIAGD